ncbi:GIY-YIG nuclease family protein [Sporolactobacillus sp. STSJ-5]|uniref:GIY-YIG nuclease family protein n=1 Tax=Sporolactobacillus sp. STSJ-5 TaxID=2965076 RepID=UPI0021047932|nr:GIY-YIG nuclease family protein [Sporolactobacillus sp. STSJ-5]MCQ2011183.1 GIY-YIG nuclease family protein [Sporolactobacillus sp. STSJ-5]
MNFGKSIRIFLIEGDPNGRWVCELSNWTGKAYKIPRTLVKSSSDRQELSNTGIYFLFGKKDEDGTNQVYIGEAENVLERLNQHLLSKEFWTECIVFISKDNNLNKAHIKYLENRIYSLAKDANRYRLVNANTPTQSSLSESDGAEMEEFIENAKLLMSVLGHKVLEPAISNHNIQENNDYYSIRAARGADAKGKPVADGFAVTKGSTVAVHVVSSMPSSLKKLRNKLISEGAIDENYRFTEDRIFSSPSLAATIVMGRNANGRTEWKNKDGQTLKSVETEP